MDVGTATVIATAITTGGLIATTLINAAKDTDKAVSQAVKPLSEQIERLKVLVRSLGGNPDDAAK